MKGSVTDMDRSFGVHQHHTFEWRGHQRCGQGLFRCVALHGHTCNIRRMSMHPLNRPLTQVAGSVVIQHRLSHVAKLSPKRP